MWDKTLEYLYDKDNGYITSDTLESITDGIFAVAMTILTFSIVVPNINQLTGPGLSIYLDQLKSQIFLFFICFVVLGNNWITERELLDSIEKTDKPLMYITLFLLMFVSLYPIFITLVTNFGDKFPIFIRYYHIINLCMGLMLVVQWYYICSKNLHLKISTSRNQFKKFMELYNNDLSIKTSAFRTFYYPVVVIISLIVSIWYPEPSRYLYVLLLLKPLLDKYNTKYYYKKLKSKALNNHVYLDKLQDKVESLSEEERNYLYELVNNLDKFDDANTLDRHKVIDILLGLHPEIQYDINDLKDIKKEHDNFDKEGNIEYFIKFKAIYNYYKNKNIPIMSLKEK